MLIQNANKNVEANAPMTEHHSVLEIFSLKKRADTAADRAITPPDTRGNCTDAGTFSAAKRRKKLPP